jgi:glycosyltransferase involved in cell wall biosynthesis
MKQEGGLRLLGDHKDGSATLPLVTILTVVYNRADTVVATLDSVLGQTYPNIEYIIIDGGSTDGTLEVVKRYDAVVDYWVSEPDSGIYDALNKGLCLSHGALVGILHSDDVFCSPDSIAAVVEKYTSADEFIVSPVVALRDGRKSLIPVMTVPRLNRQLPFSHTCCVFPMALFKRFGVYDTNFHIAGDSDFIMRLFASGICYQVMETPITIMSMGGLSNQSLLKERLEYYRAFVRHYNNRFAGLTGFLSTLPRWYLAKSKLLRSCHRFLSKQFSNQSK